MKFLVLAAALSAAAAVVHAAPVTIDFDALPTGGFTAGTEDGFTLAAADTDIVGLAHLVSGFSSPNFLTGTTRDVDGLLNITKTGGGSFTFSSFAAYYGTSAGVNVPYRVEGSLNGAQVGVDTYSLTTNNNGIATVFGALNLANKAIDTLTVFVFTGTAPNFNSYIDNIVLGDAPVTPQVPVPAAGLLLAGGLGALGVIRRKARAVATA